MKTAAERWPYPIRQSKVNRKQPDWQGAVSRVAEYVPFLTLALLIFLFTRRTQLMSGDDTLYPALRTQYGSLRNILKAYYLTWSGRVLSFLVWYVLCYAVHAGMGTCFRPNFVR